MINYAVDEMDAFLTRLRAKGVAILRRDDDDPNGRFAWILDPEGNKIEFWEPKRTAPPDGNDVHAPTMPKCGGSQRSATVLPKHLTALCRQRQQNVCIPRRIQTE